MNEPSLKGAPDCLEWAWQMTLQVYFQFPRRVKVWRNTFPVQATIQVSLSGIS